ncbi:MAG: hypothetical protein IT395_06235, partial [Candidatus Omnitrophica bacterium]|nr:hypothetical protein [Candidatus Omnitrophota bacterium]
LVKYFLAALTIPDKESWVNLSPSEKDRIIPDVLGQTLMGKAMLEQDYILKQLASSLTNPEDKLGQEFWSKVRAQVGNENVETSTLSKVWIVPSKAEVLESNGIVLVGEKKLKVMMDEEMSHQMDISKSLATDPSSEIFRSTILPKIDKEINEGKNFAEVRQIYNSVILATWYKKALKDSLLGKVYADKGKVAGVETDDKEMKQRIYDQYLAAFKKGVYNLIKEETDTVTGETIPRKYFSGGLTIVPAEVAGKKVASAAVEAELSKTTSTISIATVQGTTAGNEAAAVKAKVSASSGVNDNRQAQIQKEINFHKAVMTYKSERQQRAYQTIIWWAQQNGFHKPFMMMDALDKTIALVRDLRNEDPQVIKEFLSLVSVLINYAMKNTSGDRARIGALLANNYNKFSMFYDLLFNEELTNPLGTLGIPSRVVGVKFHSDLVIKADAVLTDAQKAQFVARYQSVYPDLTDFYTLEAWAQKQDNIKIGSGRIWNYLILFTDEKIAEAQALSARETSVALVSNAARWKAERMRVNQAADELLLTIEHLIPAMQGISYEDMSAFHVLLREVVYEGYYIYLQDESVETAMDRALDIAVMKNLTTLNIPGRSPMSLQEVKQYLERLGFEPNGRPGEAIVEPLTMVLKKLSASSASSALESETAINSVVGEIEGMLGATKDFKEESELDLARLSRVGRESYAAFRLRRAQWPVDLKALREDVENYKTSQRGDLFAGILKTAEGLANEIRTFWEVKDKPQSWSYWVSGRDVAAGRAELMSTGKEIGRYEFLSALRHGLISQGDLVIVNVNDDAPARFRRPQRFGTIEKMVAPGLIELWRDNKVNLDLDGVITFENDPASGFSVRDVIGARLVTSASSGVNLKDYLISKLSSMTFFTAHDLGSVGVDQIRAVWAEMNKYTAVIDSKFVPLYGGDVRGDFLGTVKVGEEEVPLTRFVGLKNNPLDSEAARSLVGPVYVLGNQLDKVFLNFESFENLPDTITVTASSGVERQNLVGQSLNDQDAIINAFKAGLLQVGDQVDIRFTQFDASGNPTIKAFTDAITAVNPMQVKGVINGNTIIRVGTSGTKLENVQSITLVALSSSSVAASSGAGEVQAASTPVGGIDFDPTNMNLQIKRDGKGVPLPLPQQNLEHINIEGLFPVIINIVPVNSQTLPVFLGRADSALPLGRS